MGTGKIIIGLLLSVSFLTGCGGGGGGDPDPDPPVVDTSITEVSGRVALSSILASPRSSAAKNFATNHTGSPLSNAQVEMYDADQIDWTLPVADTETDADGNYTLSTITNVNTGSGHSLDADIPAGNYTIIAFKFDLGTGAVSVAVQAFVKNFSGVVTGNDLIAQDDETVPVVTSMLGRLAVNNEGVYGGDSFPVAENAAIQVTFNVAMARTTLLNALSIKDPDQNDVSGTWKISPNLQAATFYPLSDTSIEGGTIYTIGVADTAISLYQNSLASAVTGKFLAVDEDTTPPNASREEPVASTNIAVSTKIKIKANELLDINTFVISSTPSIGDKPTVLYKGVGTDTAFPFLYEIVPNGLLELNTDYSITVSGAQDMAGNSLPSTPMNFKTTAVADTTAPVTTPSPAGGTFSGNMAVVLTSNEASTIYYTTDGSTPDSNSDVYLGPISITATTTLKFFGVDASGNSEAVQTETYTINPNCVLGLSTLGNCTVL